MQIKALQIGRHLRSSQLEPLYVVCGEEESLIAATLGALKNKNESDDKPGSTSIEFNVVDDHRQIFDELYTQPFLGMQGKRMVVVRAGRELAETASDQLTEYAKKPSKTSVLVLCCDKLDKRKNPARTLSKKAVWVDCNKVRWDEARQWVRSEAKRNGKSLAKGTDYVLLQAVGPHISALKRELDKLVLYVGDKKVIDQRAVDDVVPASRARTVFELSDTIAAMNTREAVHLGETLLLHGEAPEMIVAFLSSRMRDLWQVARLARRRVSHYEISKQVGMPDFAVKRALEAVRGRDDKWFAARLKMLSDADTELKTASLPTRERGTWLTGFIVKLCCSEL